jgi:uncharacterized protein (DUF1684 family)
MRIEWSIGSLGIAAFLLPVALAGAPAGQPPAPKSPPPPAQAARRVGAAAYRAEIAKFQQERTAELTADDGWLTVAGLFWLKPGVNVAGSAPGSDITLPASAPRRFGVFELKDGRVTFRPDPAAHVKSGSHTLGAEAITAPEDDEAALAAGHLRMFVIQREDRFGVRLRDLKSTTRAAFKGLRFYPVRPEYRVRAKFVAYEKPHKVAVPNVLGQNPEMTSPGYVTFTLKGRDWRLEPVYEDDDARDLFFIFKDLTSRDATYPAGRFLHAALPRAGMVVLDFNKAYNPPCAFTNFATCPLPRKENQLAVRVEAGELAYHPRVKPPAGPPSRPR